MEPRIQYAKTSDGVSIAWAATGEGPPVLSIPIPPFSNLAEWEAFMAIARPSIANRRLITYDSRGTGLSDRIAIDFSMAAMLRDLDAVLAQIGSGPFALAATGNAAPIAVTYAVDHPERISHLILIDAWIAFSDWARSTVREIESSLRGKDWDLFCETYMRVLWGIEDPAVGKLTARWMQESCTPEAYRACYEALEGYDATSFVPKVTTRTLVIHNRHNRWVPLDVGQRLAASIPGARLAIVEDLMYSTVGSIARDFTDEVIDKEHSPRADSPTGTAIILFADIADSTGLTERLGDSAFRAKARELDGALRKAMGEHGGTCIDAKTLGDGVLAVFTSAREAIEAALACADVGNREGLPLHVGLHAGDVIREEGNVYGGAVNIASRISALSAPGEVLVSDIVRGLARTSAGVRFEDRGEQELKGVGEAVRVWAVVAS